VSAAPGSLLFALTVRDQALARARELAATGQATDGQAADTERQLRECELAYQRALAIGPVGS
jgi:hypothetical protein